MVANQVKVLTYHPSLKPIQNGIVHAFGKLDVFEFFNGPEDFSVLVISGQDLTVGDVETNLKKLE